MDGFVLHNRKLNVEHPHEPGRFISADVRDPLFELSPNPYTVAAQERRVIMAQVKPAYRKGRLERLYILNFEGSEPGEEADAA